MSYTAAEWAEKKRAGWKHYLFWEGFIKLGGPFAVVMQLVGYFLLNSESQTIGEYFAAMRTWITFFLHGTIFGGVMGILNWYRNEKAFGNAPAAEGEDK